MRCDPRGSVWRRWDLHFHTPASFDYAGGKPSAKELVDGLIAASIQVVAVTDHHVIDVGLIQEMQAYAADRLTVLPGIELRTELGGKESVHVIGIFSEDCDVDDVWAKLQVQLAISPKEVLAQGDESISVQYDVAFQRIHDLNGIVSTHAGKKTNSIENVANAHQFKQAFKANLLRLQIDLLEVGKANDCQDYEKIVFPDIKARLPLIICSDNHDIRSYSTKCPLWIKADATFLGLRQLLNQPVSRVYLGDEPPSIMRVAQNATKYITGVSFEKTVERQDGAEWFGGKTALSTGLIAVIGNKGSGKSAVADVLGLLGDTRLPPDHFSFLCKDRFLRPKDKFGRDFVATVAWASEHTVSRGLDCTVDVTAPERVKYIPQSYLETICTELRQGPAEGQFDSELKEVIFSHVAEADRLGRENLDELIKYLTREADELITQIAADIAQVNRAIAVMEERSTPEFRQAIMGQLEQRRLQIRVHEDARPAVVPRPELDPVAQATSFEVTKRLQDLAKEAVSLQEVLKGAKLDESNATAKLTAADKLIDKIANLVRQYNTFLEDAGAEASLLGVDLGQIAKLDVNAQPLTELKAALASVLLDARSLQDVNVQNTPAQKLSVLAAEGKTLREELDEPNRKYQAYLQALREWETTLKALTGEPNVPDSLMGLDTRLKELATLPGQISSRVEKGRTGERSL